jgi:thioredoxin 1
MSRLEKKSQPEEIEPIQSTPIPILIDCWAEWCGPCKMMKPIIEEIELEYETVLKVEKINVEENKSFAREYKIISIPTFILFYKGKEITRMVGAVSKGKLKNMINEFLTYF